MPTSQVTKPIFNDASALVYRKFSISKVTAGSIKDIAEVIAAKNNRIKKGFQKFRPLA